jgi:membrane protease YdiL (CAAX protease family)
LLAHSPKRSFAFGAGACAQLRIAGITDQKRMILFLWNRTEHRLRSGWRIVLQLLFLGSAFALLVVAMEWLVGLHKSGAWLPDLGKGMFDKVMDFIAGPTFALLVVLSVVIAARLFDRRDWRDLGLRLNRDWWSDFWFGLILGGALIALVFFGEVYFGWVEVERRTVPGITDVAPVFLWAFIVLKALCIGTQEEILTRGYQLKNIAEGLHGFAGLSPGGAAIFAAILTSIAFSTLHATTDNFDFRAFVGLTLNGLLLALPVLLTGRLGTAIGLHMMWNFSQGALFGFPVSGDFENISLVVSKATGPVAWTGGAYGPEAGYLGWLAMLIGALAIALRVGLKSGRIAVLSSVAQYVPRGGPPE